MKTRYNLCVISLSALFFNVTCAFAEPDMYPGDTSIYGVASTLQPNVLIALDTSSSMRDPISGGEYDANTIYTPTVMGCTSATTGNTGTINCDPRNVYLISNTVGDLVGNSIANNVSTTLNSLPSNKCGSMYTSSLISNGYYLSNNKQLNSNGTCGSNSTKSYATGNYLNYLNSPSSIVVTKADVAIRVLKNMVNSTPNIKFGLMTFYKKEDPSATGGGQFMKFTGSPASSSTPYITSVKKMDDPFPSTSSTTTNKDAFKAAINAIKFAWPTIPPPYGETEAIGTFPGQLLLEAGRSFGNCDAAGSNCGAPAFDSTIGVVNGKLTTATAPIEAPCQKNYVILITDGLANRDGYTTDQANLLGTICDTNSCEPDGCKSRYCSNFPIGNNNTGINNATPAIAKYLYNSTQNISTYTIGFGLSGSDANAIAMLGIAADSTHGRGKYYNAGDEAGLTRSLLQIVSSINEVNSTFVAPVVPVSPQNRTYGADRVYMGFFTPQTGVSWIGNLKKYGLIQDTTTQNLNIKDANGNFATWVDNAAPFGIDDNTAATIPSGFSNGSFRSTTQSYWGSIVDGGDVDKGGVGGQLENTTPSARVIKTMLSSASTSLVDFDTTHVSPAMLNVTLTSDRDKIVNFIRGTDTYDHNINGNTTENREWIMGDVLHSRPVVVNYATYSSSAEATTANKSLIFVGSNDGMLHAFNDYNGTEAWSFVPPDLLPTLQNIPAGVTHSYFVDSSVTTYTYNKSNDGIINTAHGDKVIIIFGEGRGGGSDRSPTTGNYYALDVSNPASPTLLWTFSNATNGFSELAETWSEPKIIKIRTGSTDKIAAVFGAGYDNPHEDGRYGATQNFQGVETGIAGSATGTGNFTSSNPGTGTAPYYTSAKGRGIYIVTLATLTGGVPTVATANPPAILWSYTYGATASATTNPALVYSFPTNLATIDATNSGYTNRIYAGDTGGNIWRFDLSSANSSSWTGSKIFSSNPLNSTDTDRGRKIFYPPSIVSEPSYKMLFFGTGDREHPLNLAVTDRMYALKDYGPAITTTTKYETNMLDVTADTIQETNTNTVANKATVDAILNTLSSSSNYGWFIKLNEVTNDGEKVLAAPTVFNKVAYFTTFKPGSAATTTLCSSDVGVATLYALNYRNGNSVINYDTTNDSTTTVNKNSTNSAGKVLLRSDRKQALGTGIPSGVVVVVAADGTVKALTSTGSNIINVDPLKGGTVIPMYWRQK
ncbi:MAG: hypothetical protein HIU83_03320 [Proteobacteria bacterium]|nr:hypothetical protein [Pseudomonadota bacterium]